MRLPAKTAKKIRITDADLPRVGPETPAGQWLRRYWICISTDEDLKDIPVGLRILGEELVLFRDLGGRVGLVGLHCPHRASSLEYGDIEDRGIRCAYHGWLFDVSGQCLEQPAEPRGSNFHDKIKHLAYPVRELGGLLFAYMGPGQDDPPPLPKYSPLVREDGRRFLEPPRYYDYSWVNFFENAPDVTHLSILHRYSGYGKQSWGNNFFSYEDIPPFESVETEFGLKAVSRKPGPEAETEFVHELGAFFPSIVHLGSVNSQGKQEPDNEHTIFLTPNDDHSFTLFAMDFYTGSDPDFFEKMMERRYAAAKEEPKPYDTRRHKAFRGSIVLEDIVTQGTQGLLGERDEHLGQADRGVIMLRKLMRREIQKAASGGRPKGVLPKDQAERVIDFGCFTGVKPKGYRPGSTGGINPTRG